MNHLPSSNCISISTLILCYVFIKNTNICIFSNMLKKMVRIAVCDEN